MFNKCGWCEDSYLENGVLKCSHRRCLKSRHELLELLKAIGGK